LRSPLVRLSPHRFASFDPFFTFFRGGLAAFEDERRVGAVRVSGRTRAQDEELVRSALAAAGLEAPR